MIKNGQLNNPDGLSVWDEFYALAALLQLEISTLVLQHDFAATKPILLLILTFISISARAVSTTAPLFHIRSKFRMTFSKLPCQVLYCYPAK